MLGPIKRKAKDWVEKIRRARVAAALEKKAPHVTRQQLQQDLATLGVRAGDTVFLHSSLKSLGYVEGGAAAVIQALQNSVSARGNIILPTYWLPGGTIENACQMADYQFDPRIHGTHMGRLPETFLATAGVERSLHPTHSVSAWGKDAKYLTDAHHLAPSVFGKGSPWERFYQLPQAKVLGLGISMGPVTFYHLLEDSLGDEFPVKVWNQEYQLRCIDEKNKVWTVPVRSYEKSLARFRIDHREREDLRAYFMAEFLAQGLLTQGNVGEARSWLIDAKNFYRHLDHLAAQGMTIYSTPEQLAARPIEARPAAVGRSASE